MPKKGLTEKQFNEALRRLQAGETLDEISARVGIKESTIKSIRQAKTFTEYERRREMRTRRASADRALNPAPKPAEAPARRGAKPGKRSMVQIPTGASVTPVAREQVGGIDRLGQRLEKTASRLDRYIHDNNDLWNQFYDQEFKPLCKDFREVKEAVAQVQKRHEREAAKRRRFHKTFVGRIVKRFHAQTSA